MTVATPVNAINISTICFAVSRSPKSGTATITITSGDIALMSAAFASDVSCNDANASVCAIANVRPPASATRSVRQVTGDFASHAISNATGTASQFLAAAIVSTDASTARTNSGPIPQSTTTSATARYPIL